MTPGDFVFRLGMDPKGRRLLGTKPTPLQPAWMGDAAILVEGGRAGVDLDGLVGLLEGRIKRVDPWEPEKALEAARSLLAVKTAQVMPGVQLAVMRNAKPRRFVWEFDGHRYENGVEDVDSRRAFSKWAKGYLPSMPVLPAAKDWDAWIADQMNGAEQEEVDAEDTEDGFLAAVVAEALRCLEVGENYNDFVAGKAISRDGHRMISAPAFLQFGVWPKIKGMTPGKLRSILVELAWKPGNVFKLEKATVRAWSSPDVFQEVKPTAQRIADHGAKSRLALVPVQDDMEPFFDDVGGGHD